MCIRDRSRTPPYYSSERFPSLPLCTVLGHGQLRATRERFRTPLHYSSERFPDPPALHRLGSWSVAGDARAVSNTSVLLVRAVSGPSGPPPPWVMVSCGRRASGFEHLCTTRPSGFGTSRSAPPWVIVSCGRCASGLEHLCTTRPSGSTARCGRRASGLGQRCTTRPSGFAPPRARRASGPHFLEHAR